MHALRFWASSFECTLLAQTACCGGYLRSLLLLLLLLDLQHAAVCTCSACTVLATNNQSLLTLEMCSTQLLRLCAGCVNKGTVSL
jgi:hypothetical protein